MLPIYLDRVPCICTCIVGIIIFYNQHLLAAYRYAFRNVDTSSSQIQQTQPVKVSHFCDQFPPDQSGPCLHK